MKLSSTPQFLPLLLSQQKGDIFPYSALLYFSLFRYQAICHPLTLNSRTGVGRAKRVILILWTCSIISALPWAVFAKVNYIKYNGQNLLESAWCSMPFHENHLDTTPLYFTIASTIVYFVIPFTIVFVLYLRYCHETFSL